MIIFLEVKVNKIDLVHTPAQTETAKDDLCFLLLGHPHLLSIV
jgi:hypothetical protein